MLGIGIAGFYRLKTYARTVKDEHCLTTQISSRLFDFNHFTIETFDGLNRNDFKVINLNSGKIIYENGSFLTGIKNDYGHCVFELYHKGEKVYQIGHFKYNNWVTNDYSLILRLVDGEIEPKLIISGKNAAPDLYYRKSEGLIPK